MKLTDKRLERIILNLAESSFYKGKLYQPKVETVINGLKKLSGGSAIKALNLYLRLIKRAMDQKRLYIETPIALSLKQIDAIVDMVDEYHDIVETEVVINKKLLAGFRIKIGDQIYDDSSENKIRQLTRAIRE